MNQITVVFKERYMPCAVERVCVGMTLEQVVKTYGLNNPDIEYWHVVENKEK